MRVCHGKHKLYFLMCSGQTIGKPLLLFSSTFSPPEMAQKVPAYSICWDKSELQKEYFLEGKWWGLPQCLASKTCKQLASFHKQTVHIKRVCSFLSIQAEKPKCLCVWVCVPTLQGFGYPTLQIIKWWRKIIVFPSCPFIRAMGCLTPMLCYLNLAFHRALRRRGVFI